MELSERIPVYVYYRNGRTVCICKRDNKRCDRECAEDIVERDKFRDWEETMNRDKYGR